MEYRMQGFKHHFRVIVVFASCISGPSLSGCASRSDAATRLRPGMTSAEVREVMRGSRYEGTVIEGDETIDKYSSGDYVVFVDGKLQRHYRHANAR